MIRVTTLRPFVALLLLACAQEGPAEESGMDTSEQTTATDTAGDEARFEADSVEALFYAGDDPVWVLTAKADDTWLYIENYPSFGGAEGAETRILDGVELNYATCGVCVLVKTGCQVHGDHAHCDATFMPEAGGSVTFDDLGDDAGDSWSGSITPMRFIEVSVDSDTFETTPISDGETIELGGWDFDVVLKAGG